MLNVARKDSNNNDIAESDKTLKRNVTLPMLAYEALSNIHSRIMLIMDDYFRAVLVLDGEKQSYKTTLSKMFFHREYANNVTNFESRKLAIVRKVSLGKDMITRVEDLKPAQTRSR